ncbi:hypothetical protein Tco_1081902 [Tanacetum coccineum]|uniref:Uncharacterized protein n=1 Tax=Tanacetum coccineum TaxID=301880 RepID=A0ABQ5I0K3_9ASTR
MAFGVSSTWNSYSSYSYHDFKDYECMTSEETVESKLNNASEVVDEDIQLMTVADHENASVSIVVSHIREVFRFVKRKKKT